MTVKLIGFALAAILATGLAAEAAPQTYDTPEAAVADLIEALEAHDRAAVLAVFGPENEDILSTGNPEEDREIWGQFLGLAQEMTSIDVVSEDRAALVVGRDFWPFPAPIVRTAAGWSFDAEAAREEVTMRRIGRNELEAIRILRRASEVQAAYRTVDHDGDGVMEYAASILSSPGAKDGLYWPAEEGGPLSPFDDRVARANLTGYAIDGQDVEPDPWEGYYFRILQGQGPDAPGGAYSYMINGNMVAGYAVVAFPARYGDTGIMSFMVGENGVLLEADLGEETLATAMGIEVFNPDETWFPVE
jgi:hypothetical protein